MSPLTAERETVINQSSPQRMKSHVVLQRSGPLVGQLDVVTRTWTGILFRGFVGGVYILLRHESGAVVGVTGLHIYDVAGKYLGRGDRTEYWSERFDPAVAELTHSLEIIQTHARHDTVKGLLDDIGRIALQARDTVIRLQVPA